MERKEFIKVCSLGMCGLGFSFLLENCAGIHSVQTISNNNKITVDKNEFVQIKKGKTSTRKVIIVRTEKLSFPIALFRLNENNYSALLMQCSHKNCELNPQGDYLVCPCHGSEFNNQGKVLKAPADKDLINFKVSTDHQNIYIQLS